ADATAELIQLREAERVSAIDEHGVGVGDVEPGFDDHRRDKNVDLPIDEVPHHFLELALAHLAVSNADARPRHDPPYMLGHSIYRLDAVVDEKDLAAAIELTGDAFVDQTIVPRLDVGKHRRAIARRRLHQSHVAQAGQRQMEC